MKIMAFKLAKHNLWLASQSLAPDKETQRRFNEFLEALDNEQLSQKEFLCSFVGAMYDGLAYGNWPSAVYRKGDKP